MLNTLLGLATSFHNFVRIMYESEQWKISLSDPVDMRCRMMLCDVVSTWKRRRVSTILLDSSKKNPHHIFPSEIKKKKTWQFLHHIRKHLKNQEETWLETVSGVTCNFGSIHKTTDFILMFIYLFVYSHHQGWTTRMVKFFGKILWNNYLSWI